MKKQSDPGLCNQLKCMMPAMLKLCIMKSKGIQESFSMEGVLFTPPAAVRVNFVPKAGIQRLKKKVTPGDP